METNTFLIQLAATTKQITFSTKNGMTTVIGLHPHVDALRVAAELGLGANVDAVRHAVELHDRFPRLASRGLALDLLEAAGLRLRLHGAAGCRGATAPALHPAQQLRAR